MSQFGWQQSHILPSGRPVSHFSTTYHSNKDKPCNHLFTSTTSNSVLKEGDQVCHSFPWGLNFCRIRM
ncbi:hypothetical protein BDM02DRAFT_3117561 [Thelephora ganbajun]|uniref:Uncharacterized protein n=1 Tax=Thelephora ganbajun TaxID=370292 RepID=A0ACB6ZBZ6_THEGA|nr:hypothetical protein BDM02DRAFT_3117561 [Thelephora ganbajun]